MRRIKNSFWTSCGLARGTKVASPALMAALLMLALGACKAADPSEAEAKVVVKKAGAGEKVVVYTASGDSVFRFECAKAPSSRAAMAYSTCWRSPVAHEGINGPFDMTIVNPMPWSAVKAELVQDPELKDQLTGPAADLLLVELTSDTVFPAQYPFQQTVAAAMDRVFLRQTANGASTELQQAVKNRILDGVLIFNSGVVTFSLGGDSRLEVPVQLQGGALRRAVTMKEWRTGQAVKARVKAAGMIGLGDKSWDRLAVVDFWEKP